MYNPSPFLISSAALTSIFSFFFGGYFREREKAYRLWIEYFAYDGDQPEETDARRFCAELESKERVLRQARGILKILLFTLIIEFFVFQGYSFKYIMAGSPFYEPDAMHTFLFFDAIIGIIVLINCFELLYIRVAVAIDFTARFPFFHLRKRVTGQDRLSMLWDLFDCPKLKNGRYRELRIPEKFYDDRDPAVEKCGNGN